MKKNEDIEKIELSEIIIQEKEASELFYIAERTVRKTFKEARVGVGEYDLIKCIQIYVKNNNDKSLSNILTQKKIDKYTIENQIKDKEYIHIEDIKIVVADMVFKVKSKLFSLHKKLPSKLYNQPEKSYEKIIFAEVIKIVNELKNNEELENEFRTQEASVEKSEETSE